MSQAVKSLSTDVKSELDETLTTTEIPEVEFDLTNVFDMTTANIELLGYNYHSPFLADLFDSIEQSIQYHLDDEIEREDIISKVSEWVTYLANNTEPKHNRTTHLYHIQDLVAELEQEASSQDTLTIVVEIHKQNSRIWVHNNRLQNPEIQIHLDESPSYAEKSSLQEYADDYTKDFVFGFPYQRRPRPQWKRTLRYSITNTEEETIVEADRISERISYSRMERLFKLFNLELPSRDEPIPKTTNHKL